MVVIPKHARKQMEKRGINEFEAIEVIKNGEIIFSEINERLGTKNYSKIDLGNKSLVAVWFWNKKGEEELVTIYWRKRR